MKDRKFWGPKHGFGKSTRSEPNEIAQNRTPISEFKDIWCECTIKMDGDIARAGVVIGISNTGARIRFRQKTLLSHLVRIHSSRLGLDREAKLVWQEGFDAELVFL